MILLNYRRLLLFTSWLLGALSASGQTPLPAYSILVLADNDTYQTDYRVEVTRKADFVFLRYARLDSMQETKIRQDPAARAYVAAQGVALPQAERNALGQRFVAAVERNKVYRWDSLRVRTAGNQPLVQLLDSIYASSAAQLAQEEENQNRFVLHGTSVHVLVQSGGKTEKDFYARSPGSTSHPQLYRLLHETLELYRQQQPAPLLTKAYTHGY